jgi:hypothetical protein
MSSEIGAPRARLTPEDLYSQARRFDVDLDREPYLLPLIKQAATIPRPPQRQPDGDDGSSERYFLDQITLVRNRHQANRKEDHETSAWMAFEELVCPEVGSGSRTYYYDFATKSRQHMHPLTALLGDDEWTGSDDPMTRAADPQEFEHAATLHKQTSMKK